MISRQGDRYLIEGPMTLEGVSALLAEGSRSFEGSPVVVDLSGVTEADSSAISLMLEWTRRMHGSNRQIFFANLGESLVSIANLYGVTDLIPVAAE
ncbi:MAG TPA: STAS domain-containing protein [Burkholderiales bacterium]|jgi:phospholipid transport system transporter-binding protein|nr:STAS domain-containing protein [Burkholderiales bacterium]